MKRLISIILASVMVLSMASCNTQPKMGSGNKVLVKSADNDTILLSQYLYNLGMAKATNEYYMAQMYGMSEAEVADMYWGRVIEEDRTAGDELKDSVLTETKNQAVLLKLAKKDKITYDKKEYEQVKTYIQNAIVSFASTEKSGERAFYEKYLVTSKEALEEEQKRSVISQYEKTISDAIIITPEEVKAYYEENIDKYETKTIAHILLEFPENPSEEDKAELMVKAEEVLDRVQKGEDFGELVTEFSADGGSLETKGEYEITRETNFVQPFLTWSFDEGHEVGDVGIIETDYGYHIMRFVSQKEFEEIKETVETDMKSEKYTAERQRILDENQQEWTLDEEMYKEIVIAEPIIDEQQVPEIEVVPVDPDEDEAEGETEAPTETAKP